MKLSKMIIVLLITVVFTNPIQAFPTNDYQDISDNGKMIFEVYKRVMTHYADQVDAKKLAEAGIEGMLSKLDPYTVFLQPEDRQGLDMLTKGKYGGVGIQLGLRDDSLTVIAPMEGGPAIRSGILSGDRIIGIDGNSTFEMNLDDAAKSIRGKKGTVVVLTISRYGETEPLDFELERANITVEDITYADFIGEDIAYIRLTRFSRNSASDMKKSLQNLSVQGMEKLIIDLRGNPGGLLDAAIDILELLVPAGHDLLSTRGRYNEANRKFNSGIPPIISEDVSLVILIDGGSASASEIISGAVQDLDRGIIIGNPSFGKGLVQSIFPVDRENSIKMTTAKYYIPSGRFIQKPGYLEKEIDIGPEHDSTKVFNTVGGREVTELGGITPDIEVEISTTPVLSRECWRRGLFFKFASFYMQNHELTLPVVVDDEILEDFRGFLSSKELTLNLEGEKQFHTLLTSIDSTAAAAPIMQSSLETIEQYYDDLKAERFDIERDDLILGLEREFSFQLGGTEARIASSFDDDRVILKAIDVLSDKMTYDNLLAPSEF